MVARWLSRSPARAMSCQRPQSEPHSFLERGVGDGRRGGRPARQALASDAERVEPRLDIAIRVPLSPGLRLHDRSRLCLLFLRSLLRRHPLVAHELRTEGHLGRELVVGPAQQADVLRRRLSAAGDLEYVVELQVLRGLAAPPRLAHVRAAAAVAHPDFASHGHRHVAPRRLSRLARPRTGAGPELLPLDLPGPLDDQPLDHRGLVPRRHRVPQQRLGELDHVEGLLVDRHGHLKALRRNGSHRRPRGGRRRGR